MQFASKLLPTLVILAYIFIYAPLLVLMIFSFNESRYTVWWKGFTFKWYQDLFKDELTLNALKVSLIVTTSAVAISTIIGTFTAYALYRFRFWGKRIFEAILYIPLYMPEVVMGLSLLVFFAFINFALGIGSIIIAHVAFTIPLVTLVVLARMQRIDWTLEEAAMDLGADEITTLRKVTLPLLMPGILAAALLAFPWSFNDFVVTFFVTGVGATPLPVRIYSMIRVMGISPVINALGTLIIVISIVMPALAALLLWRTRRFSWRLRIRRRSSGKPAVLAKEGG